MESTEDVPVLPVDSPSGVGSPASVTSGEGAAKLTRVRWNEESQVRLLRQYRTTMEVFEGTEAQMWSEIWQKLKSAGMELKTARSARDKSVELINAFKASNRLDEWKSGDPGSFTEKEQLLVEIVEYLNDRGGKRRQKQTTKKAMEDEKQSRKDKKFMEAATFSKRKRRSTPDPFDRDNSDEEVINTPKRERTSYNHMVKAFLDGSSDAKMKELQLKQDKLEVERARELRLAEEARMKYDLELKKMEADRLKSESDRKRDELMTTVMMEALKSLKKD